MPRSGLGLAVLGGVVGSIVIGVGALFVKWMIEYETWQFAIAGGLAVFVALLAIDWLSEWVAKRQQS